MSFPENYQSAVQPAGKNDKRSLGRRYLLAYNILSRFEDNVMLTLKFVKFFLSSSHFKSASHQRAVVKGL